MTAVFFIILLATTALLAVYTHAILLPKRDGVNYIAKENLIDPKKRPFCNAFTGCGRKRSNIPPLIDPQEFQQLQQQIQQSERMKHHPLDESLANLLEINSVNSEPAIEEVSRQILSEAKLWEAIQDVNAELRKEQEVINNAELLQDIQNIQSNCAIPPCYVA